MAVIVIYSELEVCLCLLKLGYLVMRIYRPYLTVQTGNVYLRLDLAYEKKFGYFSLFLQQIIDETAEQSCGWSKPCVWSGVRQCDLKEDCVGTGAYLGYNVRSHSVLTQSTREVTGRVPQKVAEVLKLIDGRHAEVVDLLPVLNT